MSRIASALSYLLLDVIFPQDEVDIRDPLSGLYIDRQGQLLGIQSLPQEILRQIIKRLAGSHHLRDGEPNFDYGTEKQHITSTRIIQKLRLVSKQWHEAATPFLLPILRIRLNEKSLARAEEISKASHITAGIKGVHFILDYCAEISDADFDSFCLKKWELLMDRVSTCQYHDEALSLGGRRPNGLYYDHFETDDESEAGDYIPEQDLTPNNDNDITVKEAQELFTKAIEKGMATQNAWDKRSQAHVKAKTGRQSTTEVTTTTDDEYMQLVEKTVEACRAMHSEQRDLIQEPFSRRVTTLMTRFNRSMAICFCDEFNGPEEPTAEITLARSIVNDDQFVKLMSAPGSWDKSHQSGQTYGYENDHRANDDNLHPIVLFCDIPIALAEAGIKIRALYLKCWPKYRGVELVNPQVCPLLSNGTDLTNAMDSLEVFSFDPAARLLDDSDMSYTTEQRDAIVEYLKACIRSPRLHDLILNCHELDLYRRVPPLRNTVCIDLDAILRGVQTTRVRVFSLQSTTMAMSYFTLEKLILGLDERSLSFAVDGVDLCYGSWAEILDILRDKIGRSVKKETCAVTVSSMIAGDQQSLCAAILHVARWNRYRRRLQPKAEEKHLGHIISAYVGGEFKCNPFRPCSKRCILYLRECRNDNMTDRWYPNWPRSAFDM